MQRKAKVAERRERRLQEKNLFDNDVVERRKREDSSNDLSTEGEDFDYSYYYYGEGDNYEVYIGGEYLTCPFSDAKLIKKRPHKIFQAAFYLECIGGNKILASNLI